MSGGQNVLVQNLGSNTSRSKTSRGEMSGPKRQGANDPRPKRSVRNDLVRNGQERKTSGSETSWTQNLQVQKVRGRNFLVQTWGETSRSKMSWGETSWSKMSGAKCPGPKCRGEMSFPKKLGVKSPGPKRLGLKSPGSKILPEPSLHDCEISSMIVTLTEASL